MSETILRLQRKMILKGIEQTISMEVYEDEIDIITDKYIIDSEGKRWDIVGERKTESRGADPFG